MSFYEDTIPAEFLAEVKLSLRVTSAAFDTEIERLIAAAKADMEMSGVAKASLETVDLDAPIKEAVITYCKAQFGLDNQDSEKYMASYQSMLHKLPLTTEYKETAL